MRLVGIEPSQALREIGHKKGVTSDELIDGDALALPFADSSFDIAFGGLHHIADHARAVAEMTRVAKRAVFISDANNFGQGSLRNRIFKQAFNANWGERVVRQKFSDVCYMSTRPSGANLYRSAQAIAVFCDSFA